MAAGESPHVELHAQVGVGGAVGADQQAVQKPLGDHRSGKPGLGVRAGGLEQLTGTGRPHRAIGEFEGDRRVEVCREQFGGQYRRRLGQLVADAIAQRHGHLPGQFRQQQGNDREADGAVVVFAFDVGLGRNPGGVGEHPARDVAFLEDLAESYRHVLGRLVGGGVERDLGDRSGPCGRGRQGQDVRHTHRCFHSVAHLPSPNECSWRGSLRSNTLHLPVHYPTPRGLPQAGVDPSFGRK